MTFNIQTHLENMTPDQLERMEHVKRHQRQYNMEPRDDSILTYNYACGNIPDYLDNPKVIADELIIVDYIHKNSMYGRIIQDVMREIAAILKYKYKLNWNTTWELTRFYVPDMLKLYCMRIENIQLPILET